jgi:hypothetical protein
MDEERDKSPSGGDAPADEPREFLPPLDFSSIAFLFYSQALIRMGVIEDPVKDGPGENLEYAKRMIDLLDLLKDRTQGRLKPAEYDFLEACLSELKLRYVQKTEILKV